MIMKRERRKFRDSFVAILLAISMVVGLVPVNSITSYAKDKSTGNVKNQSRAAFNEESVSDESSLETWMKVVENSTENIGRIWTDKTVSDKNIKLPASSQGNEFTIDKGNSDFLVGLSALSSTSNTVTLTEKPLDIVFVLDTSGSMGDPMEYIYSPTYSVSTRSDRYYAKVDGNYIKIDRIIGIFGGFKRWELNGEEVTPKKNASDTSGIQFYTRQEKPGSLSKMEALKIAVNQFANETAKRNDSIIDTEKQHRMSIVTFSSNGYLRQGLTAYNSSTISRFEGTINRLSANGATYANAGMEQAEKSLQNARQDAQKVVIFFTDGQPGQSGFEDATANATIQIAKRMKDNAAKIYSIGVFDQANPENTSSSFNAYMHGVSSNYPNATKWSELGEPAEKLNYYKAAQDTDGLNKIFEEIFDEVNSGSGFPTHTEEGFAGKSGYITFTDELGKYMQVDEFKDLVFADQVFKPTGSETKDGVTTYFYEGKASGDSELYPQGNLNEIIVQVKKSDNLQKGDTVTVKIPGGLIPLRHFNIDVDGNTETTMSIKEAYPMRIFYGASLKPEVVETLKDGLNDSAEDRELNAYLKDNRVDGNKAAFYSNFYDGLKTSGAKKLGNTIANFTPSKSNSFYFFTGDTVVYTDDKCLQPLKTDPDTSGNTSYYYKKSYFVKNTAGTVEKKEESVRFNGANFATSSTTWGKNNKGEVYVKAGAARLTRVDDLTTTKKENPTGTATEVINPQWDNINNPQFVNVHLGNNGRILMELPGALAITKNATVVTGKNLKENEIVKDKEFEFKITIPEMKNATVKAQVKNQQGDAVGEVKTLSLDDAGTITYSLKDDETLFIYGLDAGTAYTVTEVKGSMPQGFTLTSVDGKENETEATGNIVSGATQQHTFVNKYDVTEVVVNADDFAKYAKHFANWDVADTFKITLSRYTSNDAPMPENSVYGKKTVEVTENSTTGNFGNVTFTKPGTYGYTIFEERPETVIAGMTYSMAAYTVDVIVKDNGNGTLSAETKMTKISDDTGKAMAQNVDNKTAEFTNSFAAESVRAGAVARKDYTDNSGNNPLTPGKFTFKIKPNQDNAPAPEKATPEADGSYIMGNDGERVRFEQFVFTSNHAGNTYTYEISEVIPKEATDNKNGTYTLNGMTYDAQKYTVAFNVTTEEVNGKATVKVEKTYYKGEGTNGEVVPEANVVFNNVYTPKEITIPDDQNEGVKGSKTLVGRNSLNDERFSFTLKAANAKANRALANDWIVFENDPAKNEMTVEVSDLTKGREKDFNFGQMKITRPGLYEFNVNENIPEEPAQKKGLTYDAHLSLVTIDVKDENGVLKANVTYNNGHDGATDKAAFKNVYHASASYGDGMKLHVSKTLNGRALKAGEFAFTIAGKDKPSNDKLTDKDKNFVNQAGANDGVASVIFDRMSDMKFTEADAGKTFSYTVSEVEPVENKLGGVTYDKTVYTVELQVVDNGDGTMHTVTTVKKGQDVIGTYDSQNGMKEATLPFVNEYKVSPVIVDTASDKIKLTKQFIGREWTDNDVFEFTLAAVEPKDAPMPEGSENGVKKVEVRRQDGTDKVSFDFGSITFDKKGYYVYRVTETNAGQTINGVVYDKEVATIEITVNDDRKGNLFATVSTYEGDFLNEYKAELSHNEAGGLKVTKTLKGHDMAKGQFTFQVKALKTDTVTAEEAAKRIHIFNGITGEFQNVAGKDGQTVEMGTESPIVFTQDDVNKHFKYEFTEKGANDEFGTGGEKEGYTFDDTVYVVELWITDNGDGTLTLHTKVNDGMELVSSKENPLKTVISFKNEYKATGKLNGAEKLAGQKNIDGPWPNNDYSGFTFTIAGDDAHTDTMLAIKNGDVVLPNDTTVTSAEDGSFHFGDITFNKAGEYRFKVTENAGTIAGVTYDDAVKNVTVVVADDNKGRLTATVKEGSDKLTFTNGYNTTGNATFVPSVTKQVTGHDAVEDVIFVMTAKDEVTKNAIQAGDITGYKEEITISKDVLKKDGEPQPVTFGELTFIKAGTYTFDVSEKAVSVPNGWTYDADHYEVKIKVKDENSKLVATQDISDATNNLKRNFVNVFTAETAYGEEGGLNVTKELQGRNLKENEFNFTITGQSDEAEGKLEDSDKTFKNNAPNQDGVAVMSKLSNVTFDQNDIGKTFVYIVREVVTTRGAIAYDDKDVTVSIQVLEENGDIYTVTTVTKDENVLGVYNSKEGTTTSVAPFVNKYTPDIVTVDPTGTEAGKVTKVLKGNRAEALKDNEFTFQMKVDALEGTMDTVELPNLTATNKADGSVSFGNVTFKAAGKYRFTISEAVPEPHDANMTYDKHKFSYVVTVSYDADQGVLSTKVSEVAGSPVFTNVYTDEKAKDVVNNKDENTSADGDMVSVGDTLTYSIDWVNNAVNENGQPTKADITIEDTIPAGTEYVEGSASNDGKFAEGKLTWSFKEQAVGANGTVTFKVKVTEDAVKVDSIKNTASIKVGNNDPKQTNGVTNFVPNKEVTNDNNSSDIKVGDTVTYTIKYYNTEDTNADVTITDKLPSGLTFKEADNGGSYDKATGIITWKLTNVKPHTAGMVTFKAVVNEEALVEDGVKNTAGIQIGENDPVINTNTESFNTKKGDLTISKEIKLAEGQGTVIDTNKTFEFTVVLKDTAGQVLKGEYTYGENKKITSGQKIALKHGESVTIKGLPEGTSYEVTETKTAGYTPAKETITGTVSAGNAVEAHFVNTYSVTEGMLEGATNLKVKKDFTGREENRWLATDRFTFKLTLAEGTPESAVVLPNNANEIVINSTTPGKEAAFGNIKFKRAGEYTLNVTENPSGILGVTDDANATREVVVKVTDKLDGTLHAEVKNAAEGLLTFHNVYKVTDPVEVDTTPTDASALFEKVLDGRDWLDSDEFTFTITPEGNAPALEKTTAKVKKSDVQDEKAPFGFGKITFTPEHMGDAHTKEFTYKITENDINKDKMPGVSKDTHTAILKVTVSDNGEGKLVAATPVVTDGTFTNTYRSSIDYNAAGGLVITKVLTGRDAAKDQFQFVMTAKDAVSAEKLGVSTEGTTFKTPAAKDGETATIDVLANRTGENVVFTQADAGKTYRYTAVEVNGGQKGYTYDNTKHEVEISVEDNNDATLTVKTKVGDKTYTYKTGIKGETAVIPFRNVYAASTDNAGGTKAPVVTNKTMTGRPLTAGEFTFNVIYKNSKDVVVKDVKNSVDGAVNFGELSFTIDSLKAAVKKGDAVQNPNGTWTVSYTAVEKTDGLAENGVTATKNTFDFTITVTDNGDGTLKAVTNLPEGHGFTNAYSTGDPVEVNVNGSKVLSAEEGLTPPNIAGEFTFTLKGEKDAPMPEKTTTQNDAQGNVDFGKVSFTLENVFGETKVSAKAGEARSKTFTYTVTESGKVAGVTNDKKAKTFTLTVTDDGKGHMTVTKNPADNALFTFTNTYSIESPINSSVTDQISITKELEGRKMKAEEFNFELLEGNKVVATGTNDADGKVTFTGLEYNKPGEYDYTVREVVPEDTYGVTFDTSEFMVHTSVTDKSDGTLSVEHTTEGEIVFRNVYKAAGTSVTLGASKILKGNDLAKGQFTFRLKDENGNVVAEAKNNEKGQIIFETLEYDKAGTYKYTISEVNDKQENITYDAKVYGVTVTVVDDEKGQLKATVEGDSAVFTNEYAEKAAVITPAKPIKPNDTPVKTGDESNPMAMAGIMTIAGMVILLNVITAVRRRRQR